MLPIVDLIQRLKYGRATKDHSILLNEDDLKHWPTNVVLAMKTQKIITKAKSASSVLCLGCEQSCVMPVYTVTSDITNDSSSFVVCDKRNDINRVPILPERLQQWQCGAVLLAKVVASLLKMETQIEYKSNQNIIRLGMLKGLNGRRWLSFDIQSLSLEINMHTVALEDILFFENNQFVLDQVHIDKLLNNNLAKFEKKYTPSVDAREARKQKTQEMYQDWHDVYLRLKNEHPNKSDTWYSIRIAKLPVAKGKSSETIRKKMK